MKKHGAIVILILVSLLSLFVSCKDKSSKEAPEIQIENKAVNHHWYYFTPKGCFQAATIESVPASPELPWTEAVRISSSSCPTQAAGTDKAFGVVNRLGIITFEQNSFSISQDLNLFTDRTAGNLAFVNDEPVFSVYKSSFFNDTISTPSYHADNSQHLFLLMFDPAAKVSYPVVSCPNITQKEDTEVIDYHWDGYNWLCCLKTVTAQKNEFSYIKWNSTASLSDLSPVNASLLITVSESTMKEFRKAKELIPYKDAPDRIKRTMAGFSQKVPFILEVKKAGGSSSAKYENAVADTKKQELKATSILCESWSCVLFEDGTMYIEGALPGKHILRDGKPVAIRLPKLPGGFVYSDFVIAGTTLYAAWEETDFYKTKKSGFVSVDLDATLYSRVR